MRARVGVCASVSWLPVNLAQCRLEESVFHLMLQNHVAPNIGQKLSSNQWPVILVAGLYTTCRNERVLTVIRFKATFQPLRPYCETVCRPTSLLNGAESLTTYSCALWCRQIAYICPYSLNTTTAFYFATEF